MREPAGRPAILIAVLAKTRQAGLTFSAQALSNGHFEAAHNAIVLNRRFPLRSSEIIKLMITAPEELLDSCATLKEIMPFSWCLPPHPRRTG